MNRVIYSLFVEVPEKEHYGNSKSKYDTLDKAKITINSFKQHYKRLVENKKQYSKYIGVPFIMFEYDNQYKEFENFFLKNYPEITGYEIVNFYKIHLLYELAKKYDEILYLDFDAIPVTKESFFDHWDLSNGICVYKNDKSVNKVGLNLTKIRHGIRSPTAKFFNTQAMLIASGHSPKNNVINTGIIGARKEDILKLDFFGNFKDTLTLMTKLRKGLDGLYPKNIYSIFRYDNETIFSYKIQTNKVNIQWLDSMWHYFFDSQVFVPKETKIVHTINKKFDIVWKYHDKRNL